MAPSTGSLMYVRTSEMFGMVAEMARKRMLLETIPCIWC